MIGRSLKSKFYLLLVVQITIAPHAQATSDRLWVTENQGLCFKVHLNEAVRVNRVRREVYAKLTRDRTRNLSNLLIALDRMGTLFVSGLDERSQTILGPNGVPLLCEVIPSVIPVLEKPVVIQDKIPLSDFVPFSAAKANREILQALKNGGLIAAERKVAEFKAQLDREPRFNCLAHQFIKSMGRLMQVANSVGTREADQLARHVLMLVLAQLRILVQLDRKAATFQADGIPIICGENPDLPRF